MSTPPYILGTWKGLPRYQCPLCPFDTLDEATALDHFRQHSERPGGEEQPRAREEYIVIPPEALSEETQNEIAQIAAEAVIDAKKTKRGRKGAEKE
jgi:t-SNARE complex subunit (syntaxin)